MTNSLIPQCRRAVELMDNNEMTQAFKIVSRLVDEYQTHPLSWHCLGEYYLKQKNIFKAIHCFTKTLQVDPTFVMTAEKLIELNVDNYSVGEMKYLYQIILRYKPGDEEMYQFMEKFAEENVITDLSSPDVGLDDMSVESLPGTDNKDYIEHLIHEMDAQEEELPEEHIETVVANLPQAIPLPKRKPAKNGKHANNEPAYKIETLTMARLYIRQGLYEQAKNILLKLQKRNPESQVYRDEIQRVDALILEVEKETN